MKSFRRRLTGRLPHGRMRRDCRAFVLLPELTQRPSPFPRAPSRQRPAPELFAWRRWLAQFVPRANPGSLRVVCPIWERNDQRAARQRLLCPASREELRRPALRWGWAPSVSTFPLRLPWCVGPPGSSNVLQLVRTRAAWTRTSFAGTRPCRTGKRCYTAILRYRRCQVNPADGLAMPGQRQGATRHSMKSISLT